MKPILGLRYGAALRRLERSDAEATRRKTSEATQAYNNAWNDLKKLGKRLGKTEEEILTDASFAGELAQLRSPQRGDRS